MRSMHSTSAMVQVSPWNPSSITIPNTEGTGLPKANVLEFRLAGGAKLMVRPSGTEPKIKVYLSAVAPTEEAADAINKLYAASKELLQA